MEEVRKKLVVLSNALKTLEEGVILFDKYQVITDKQPTDENEKILRSMRDSLIQRFEYCIDLFWKITRSYLESGGIIMALNAPRGVLREAVKARLLSEDEGSKCMKMVEARNRTSHTYHEDMAEKIARQVPEFYELMQKIAERMQKKWR